ncbi:sugar ABC transporter substrate-binding protein [Brachybacterium halotolerans subsp. kimchii]|uniref:ABC transporter substrate-binding protein n=1 Tax=Brachybacterium halotolerans TaxID=2795215 RepID=UPI001E3B57A7|nr:sugar ABC transporter substrate-binding protein [Brachybacterium halotolerans]UEJ81924.1 sugar ABC transporter substrate-binding protein [Brachybacterium halotolerans subsp. kimchii]
MPSALPHRRPAPPPAGHPQRRSHGRPQRSAGRIPRRSLLAGGAAAAASVPLLGACGRADADRPLTFWNFYSPAPQQDPNLVAQSDWFQKAIDRWNHAGEHEITSVYMTSDQMNQRMPVAFASGDGPDIFLISPGDYLRYANGGVLVDLAPYMEQEAIADYFPEALTTRRDGDRIFGLPMEQEPLALFYDPDLLEKKGVSEGDLPKDWDELLELAASLSTGSTTGLVLDVDPGYYQNFTFYPWVWQTGGDVIDPTTQRPVFDADGPRAALELWGRAVSTGATPRTRPANGDIVSAFTSGYAAFWESGVWEVMNLTQNAPDKRFGVLPLPPPPGEESSTILGGWAWCVNARGADPEAAARFVVQTLGSMDEQSIDHIATWNGPAKGNMPARRSVDAKLQADDAYAEEHQKIFHDEILPTGRGEPRFPPVVYKAVSDALQSVELGGGDPGEESARAQQTIESYLETYEGGSLV